MRAPAPGLRVRGARTPPTLPATGAGRRNRARRRPGPGATRGRRPGTATAPVHPTAWAVRTRLVATEPSRSNGQCARSAVVNQFWPGTSV